MMMNDHLTDEEPTGGLGEMIACGILFLGVPTLLAIGLILVLLRVGIQSEVIEKGMVWLSVPWFALCYALCKTAHGTKLVIVDEDGNPIGTPPEN
jgi:hypothetical protein